MPTVLPQSNLPGLELIHRGKVRDVYALSDQRLLMIATDRLSAFDVVMPNPIPGKGEMLTQISNFWFDKTAHLVPNHLLDVPLGEVLPAGTDLKLYEKRAVVTRRLQPVPVEAIARGYLIGSGWKDYQATRFAVRHRLARRPEAGAATARADLHPVDQGRSGRPRSERQLRRDG